MVGLPLTHRTEEQIVPDWILAPVCLVVLVGFIGYAFRQGMKVSPDRTSNAGSTENDYPDSSSGHGSNEGGGHSF
jgi:hypothetical protein